jgi:nitrate reductase NapAB chaperone NapD
MNNQGQIFVKAKRVKYPIDTRLAIRNLIFVLAICLVYLAGKHYQTINQRKAVQPQIATLKTN